MLITVLFVVMAAGTTFACWLLAWGIERLLAELPAKARVSVTFGCLGIALFCALAFEPYRTSFGRALRGGLLDVLS